MADEPETDELLLEDEVEEQSDAEAEEQEQDESQQEPEGEGEEEFEVSFGDEAAPASESDTPLIKHLRNQLREKSRELEEARKSAPVQQIEVGEKPTLASCEYDEDRYEQQLEEWRERKAQAEAHQANAGKAQREAAEEWERDLQSYRDKRAALKFADVEEVEEVATTALDQVQQAVVVKVSENPALVLYALGKQPARLAELSQIKDPLKMAAAVAKLEGTLKVTPRRKAPEPEEIARGSASVTKGTDKTLERLEKEADRTGDRTKLIAYRRQLKTQGKV